MNINRELLSKAIDMLKTFAADQVALDPSLRGAYSSEALVKVIEGLEDKLSDTDLSFSIHISSYECPSVNYVVEVTENYEGDKWHVNVHELSDDGNSGEYIGYQGCDSEKEIFDYLRRVTTNEPI